MVDVRQYWTPDDVRALPDDSNRYECIDGVLLVTPSPRALHQLALRELFRRLWPYVERQRLGEIPWSPADLELETGALVQPDIFVTAKWERAGREPVWEDVRHLVLAVELLSPSTAQHDRGLKRTFYQRAPVSAYWIVDLDSRVIERWRHEDERPERATTMLVWQPPGASAAFTLGVAGYFRAVYGA
jgi:Uma2 family endonuclease